MSWWKSAIGGGCPVSEYSRFLKEEKQVYHLTASRVSGEKHLQRKSLAQSHLKVMQHVQKNRHMWGSNLDWQSYDSWTLKGETGTLWLQRDLINLYLMYDSRQPESGGNLGTLNQITLCQVQGIHSLHPHKGGIFARKLSCTSYTLPSKGVKIVQMKLHQYMQMLMNLRRKRMSLQQLRWR